MHVTDLKPARGSRHRIKRVGRGSSSGRGKTAGRGTKGFGARAGYVIDPGFEGGQMSQILRVPKRGFRSKFRVRYEIVNLGSLDRFDPGAPVTPEALRHAGLASGATRRIKILGNGECTKALHVQAHKFSQSAVEKLAKAGGKAEVLE